MTAEMIIVSDWISIIIIIIRHNSFFLTGNNDDDDDDELVWKATKNWTFSIKWIIIKKNSYTESDKHEWMMNFSLVVVVVFFLFGTMEIISIFFLIVVVVVGHYYGNSWVFFFFENIHTNLRLNWCCFLLLLMRMMMMIKTLTLTERKMIKLYISCNDYDDDWIATVQNVCKNITHTQQQQHHID